MKETKQGMIRKDQGTLAREIEDARCVLKATAQPDNSGIGTILTEAVLVLVAGVLWWFVRDTPFLKSPWFPWVAVMFPIIALGVPLVLTIE